MSRLQKLVFIGLGIAIAFLVYLEASRTVPISWRASYNAEATIPLGTKVLHTLLKDQFEDQLIDVNAPPYSFLQEEQEPGTYLFVNDYIEFDTEELEELLNWTENGNTIFIAANTLPSNLLDTLNIETYRAFLFNSIEKKPMLELSNQKLKAQQPYLIDRNVSTTHFSKIDTTNQKGLGNMQLFNDTLKITKPLLNFIQVPFGKGTLFLHTQPEAFSNYFILNQTHSEYTQGALSYIPKDQQIYWDKYYKTGKTINLSPLYILLNNKHFKWAYYILLIGVVLFIFFEGKRKQRSVPIVPPNTNKTYEFTQTISGMYLKNKNYTAIANKQIILFFEFIRLQIRLNTEKINKDFYRKLAARTGNTFEDTESLFKTISTVQGRSNITKEELIALYRKISDYKKT